jgi:integration host factor subunit beta
MTKRELITELLVRRPGLAHHESTRIVNALFDTMAEALARGERIELRGFGSFQVRQRGARQGRNPKTGAAVKVEAKRVPFFRAGKELQYEIGDGPADAAERAE